MKSPLGLRNSAVFCALAAALAMPASPFATRALADAPAAQPAAAQELAQTQAPEIDSQAAELLQAMSNLLESSQRLAFTVEETRDILTSKGVPLQLAHVIEVVAQRPDKLWLNITGDVAERTFWDDGQTVTLLDRVNNIFATLAAPGNLTETIQTMINTYGVDLPMAQTVRTGLYDYLTTDLQRGYYVGLSTTGTDGRACHLIVGVSETVDWQIWIQDGEVPLPCKVSVTFKDREGVPRISANFTHWNLNPVIPDDLFTASVPVGTEQVEFQLKE